MKSEYSLDDEVGFDEHCDGVSSSVIEQLGGKQVVMQLLAHEDPNVRYEALLAVQKLMVHNWEYLGKQLEKEQNPSAVEGLKTKG